MATLPVLGSIFGRGIFRLYYGLIHQEICRKNHGYRRRIKIISIYYIKIKYTATSFQDCSLPGPEGYPPSSRRNPKEHVQERRDGEDVPAGTAGKIRYHTGCPCVQHLLSGTLYAATFENFHRFTGSRCNHGSLVITF